MLHYISKILILSLFANGIPDFGRKISIFDEKYFGSEQLLKTEIDDVKPFIAESTLPETGLEVTGSIEQIHKQFEQYLPQ